MLKFLAAIARKVAPTHPRAADSVGDAMPKTMEPRTRVISSRGGRRDRNNDFQSTEGP